MADNRGLSGIYRWVNKTNGKVKTYVGSGKDLSKRLYIYYKSSELIRSKRPIHQALQKYGYEGFILEILEYCNLNELIKREQHYLDILEPEYNILKIAYSLAGFKHSDESKALLKAKALLRGVAVWVLNTETGKKILFPTLIEAGKYLGVSPTSIRNTAVKGDFIKNIYLITREGDDGSISTDQAPQDNHRKKAMVKVLNTLTKQETAFYSQSEAAKFLGVTRSAVSMAIKFSNVVKDIYLVTKDATFSLEALAITNTLKVLNTVTGEVRTFTKQTEVAEFLGVSTSAVAQAVKAGRVIKGVYMVTKEVA